MQCALVAAGIAVLSRVCGVHEPCVGGASAALTLWLNGVTFMPKYLNFSRCLTQPEVRIFLALASRASFSCAARSRVCLHERRGKSQCHIPKPLSTWALWVRWQLWTTVHEHD